MNEYLPLVNTLILVIIFIWQKRKIDVLEKTIKSQRDILTQTNDLVSRQATAINSHSKIVSDALDYSEKFNVTKLQDIISREIQLEKEEEFDKIQKDHSFEITELKQSLENDKEQLKKKYSELIPKLINSVTNQVIDLFSGPTVEFFAHFLTLDVKERGNIINSFKSKSSKSFVRSILAKIDQEIEGPVSKLLSKNDK